MTSATSTLPSAGRNAAGTSPYTAGLSDGLGDRLVFADPATQAPLELLRFKKEFSEAPGFEEAVRERVEQLAGFRHPSIGTVRGVQDIDDALALVSNHVQGRRLSEMIHVARGAPFAVDLIQQLAPALAELHQQGARLAHGVLTAERIIITREGRLIVVEHVLASAFELLRLPAMRLRSELGIAVPSGVEPVGLNQRNDIIQLGFLALSLLLGRRLDPAHYPGNIGTLLEEFTHADASAAARLRPWLERALQLGDKPFATAQEAHTAFGSVHLAASQAPAPPSTAPEPPAADAPAPGQSDRSVLPFRPADSASAAPKLKTESPKIELRTEKQEPNPKPKIELKPEPKIDADFRKALDSAAPPVHSVASPRSSGKKGLGVWIAAAFVIAIGAVAGLYFTGVLPGNDARPLTTTQTDASAAVPAPSAPGNSSAPSSPAATLPPPPSTPPAATVASEEHPGAAPSTSSANGSSSSQTPATPASSSSSTPSTGSASTTSAKPPVTSIAAGATTGAAATTPRTDGSSTERPAPAAGGFGGVKVSAPIELQVYEKGALVGSTTGPIAVLEGAHTFELVNETLGFRVTSTVNVRGGQLTPLAVALPNGRVSINAVPWADVTIDGKPVGTTPLANVPVVIGQHTIVFRHPTLGEQSQTVVVKADGLTRVSAKFEQQ